MSLKFKMLVRTVLGFVGFLQFVEPLGLPAYQCCAYVCTNYISTGISKANGNYESVVNAGYCFLHFSDLRLAFSSDEEQLSWLKAFEKAGAVTGQTEEVRLGR